MRVKFVFFPLLLLVSAFPLTAAQLHVLQLPALVQLEFKSTLKAHLNRKFNINHFYWLHQTSQFQIGLRYLNHAAVKQSVTRCRIYLILLQLLVILLLS